MTFLAVFDEDDDTATLSETLASLMPEHPSRAIVVRLAPGREDLLEAGVEAQCWMPFGRRQQICAEQIVIRCTEKTLGEVPRVILPLVVADLPVVLWCASRRVWPSPAFAALAEPAGRVIVDTSRAADSRQAILAAAAESRPLSDLSWARLTRWRASLAQMFEDPDRRRRIPRLTGLTIDYAGTAQPPATAFLLAGWLVSSLGWPEPPNGRLSFVQREAGSSRLTAVELRSDSEIALQMTTDGSREPPSDFSLLSEELRIHAPDPIFQRSLQAAARIAETRP
jgi:glucose-6-phosphate dehydrogenase assembly protein OpcA